MGATMFHKAAIRGACVVGLATLVVSVSAMVAVARPAQAFEYGNSPWLACANNRESAEVVARYMPPEPVNGATVPTGTPLIFSGESKYALTFNVASSPTLLSSPDIDSGTGAQSGSFFKFTSTKATATPRTIYWTASFTFTPAECESPSTFTTPVRTLIVAPTEAELIAVKKQHEEEAVKKKLEEEGAAKRKELEEAAAGSVILEGLTLDVKNGLAATVKLTCSDVAACMGKLSLTASATTGKGKARRTKTASIGTVGFTIAAHGQDTVMVTLNKTGRALLKAAHGHLRATLAIVRTSPLPDKTQIQHVRLKLGKAAKARK
jgi:hypothetical protein